MKRTIFCLLLTITLLVSLSAGFTAIAEATPSITIGKLNGFTEGSFGVLHITYTPSSDVNKYEFEFTAQNISSYTEHTFYIMIMNPENYTTKYPYTGAARGNPSVKDVFAGTKTLKKTIDWYGIEATDEIKTYADIAKNAYRVYVELYDPTGEQDVKSYSVFIAIDKGKWSADNSVTTNITLEYDEDGKLIQDGTLVRKYIFGNNLATSISDLVVSNLTFSNDSVFAEDGFTLDSNGGLSYKLKDDVQVGDTVSVTFTLTSQNYEDFEYTIIFVVTEAKA